MPELPEVETVRRGLNQLTLNQDITGGDVLRQNTIAYPFSIDEFLAGIKGHAIAAWYRRGKYLLAELTRGGGEGERGGGEEGGGNRKNFPYSPHPPCLLLPK